MSKFCSDVFFCLLHVLCESLHLRIGDPELFLKRQRGWKAHMSLPSSLSATANGLRPALGALIARGGHVRKDLISVIEPCTAVSVALQVVSKHLILHAQYVILLLQVRDLLLQFLHC